MQFLLKSLTVCLPLCAFLGSSVHVLRIPTGPLSPTGVQPVISKEPLTLSPPATSTSLEVPQLHFYAHWVSSNSAVEFLTINFTTMFLH